MTWTGGLGDKLPRHYAGEIIALPTRAERAAALEDVPEDIREWVRFYVEDHYRRAAAVRTGRASP